MAIDSRRFSTTSGDGRSARGDRGSTSVRRASRRRSRPIAPESWRSMDVELAMKIAPGHWWPRAGESRLRSRMSRLAQGVPGSCALRLPACARLLGSTSGSAGSRPRCEAGLVPVRTELGGTRIVDCQACAERHRCPCRLCAGSAAVSRRVNVGDLEPRPLR
jgi:hypothetical protein